MDALKCFDETMTPVHEDLSLDEIQDGLHVGCDNKVLVWAHADEALMDKACNEHGVCYRFTVSGSGNGPPRYAQAHTSVP